MDSLDKAEPQKFHTQVEVSEVFCSAAFHTADPTGEDKVCLQQMH